MWHIFLPKIIILIHSVIVNCQILQLYTSSAKDDNKEIEEMQKRAEEEQQRLQQQKDLEEEQV